MTLTDLAMILATYNLRSLYHQPTRQHWFCAVDICAILFDTTCYTQARNHWYNLKRRDSRFDPQQGYVNHQLSLLARDGKLRMTNVISLSDVAYLLQKIATTKRLTNSRRRCRQWLAMLCPKTVLQALRERATQGHFELVSFARRACRQLCMTRTWVAQVFDLAADPTYSPLHASYTTAG